MGTSSDQIPESGERVFLKGSHIRVAFFHFFLVFLKFFSISTLRQRDAARIGFRLHPARRRVVLGKDGKVNGRVNLENLGELG
jgi:hypothetical protein